MFDHVKFGVSDYAASKAFFLQALEPLGVTVVAEGPPSYGVELSAGGVSSLCLFQADEKPAHLHLAFTARHRRQVDAFHRAALAAGGQDHGAPGLRPHYHANYYAAFVIGPDGHNIEAVCHRPEAGLQITFESPDQPEIIRLIDALDAYQKPLYPAESHHGIDIAALDQPDVLFAVARDAAGQALACGAILLTPTYGELKRMFVSPALRGQGIGMALLQALEAAAQGRGCRLFALETGTLQPEALALYERAGYVRCAPFGDYAEDPNSVFMQKRVAA